MSKDRAARAGYERTRLITRLLPALALAAWMVTILVPVLDSASNSLHTKGSTRIVVTSLGHSPFELSDVDPEFLIIWTCLLTCVVSAWLLDGLRAWSWATTVLGVLVLAFLGCMMADPPTVMWDGRDARGEWIGGTEVGYPAAGAALWAVGGIALIAAGIIGLIGERLRTNPRLARWFAVEPSRDGHIRVRRRRSSVDRAARLLALVSVVAWGVMIWVPIFDSGTRGSDSVVVTSLGRLPIGTDDFNLGVLLPWVGILFGAAVVWLVDPPTRRWSAVVIVIGVALFVMLQLILMDPPTYFRIVILDPPPTPSKGEDSAEEDHGVTIIGRPAAGVSYWILGSGALMMAGILGFFGARPRFNHDPFKYSDALSPK